MRLFLDANILFSAAHGGEGRAGAILQLAGRGACDLVTSAHAGEEARRNVELKLPEALARLDEALRRVLISRESSPENVEWALAQGLPPKDAPILAAAADARADLLVTGDRTHFGFLHGRKIRGVEIVTPAAALGRLLRQAAHSPSPSSTRSRA